MSSCIYCTQTMEVALIPKCNHPIHDHCAKKIVTLFLAGLPEFKSDMADIQNSCCPLESCLSQASGPWKVINHAPHILCVMCNTDACLREYISLSCNHILCDPCAYGYVYRTTEILGYPTGDAPCPVCRSPMGRLVIDRTYAGLRAATLDIQTPPHRYIMYDYPII